MKPYSTDLREKIIKAIESGEESQAELAERFDVSLSFIEKLWRRYRETGDYQPMPQGKGPARALAGQEKLIRVIVDKNPDIGLKQLCENVEKRSGIQSSPSQMCRELQILQLPLKKSRSTTARGTRRG